MQDAFVVCFNVRDVSFYTKDLIVFSLSRVKYGLINQSVVPTMTTPVWIWIILGFIFGGKSLKLFDTFIIDAQAELYNCKSLF